MSINDFSSIINMNNICYIKTHVYKLGVLNPLS